MNIKQKILNDYQILLNEFKKKKYSTEYICKKIDELDKRYKNHPAYFNTIEGLISNIGSDQQNIDVLNYAIQRLKNKKSYLKLNKYYYDLATTMGAISDIEYNHREIAALLNENNYAEIRKIYNKVNKDDINHFLRAKTNTANYLEKYGRNYEAIYTYDDALKIDPQFGMALGNKARAITYYFRIAPIKSLQLLSFAKELLIKALEDNRIMNIGGNRAIDAFNNELISIDEILKENKFKNKKKKKVCISNGYIEFILTNNLFLNYDFGYYYDQDSLIDSFFPNFIEKLNDEKSEKHSWMAKKIYYCFQIFNQILENYVSSRYLYYLAITENYNQLNKITNFIYMLDYTKHSINYGLLKTVFINLYNCLDKIAQIIFYYFDLKTPNINNKIYFGSILCDDFKNVIIKRDNFQLLALYSLCLDFQDSYPYYELQWIRNKITHSFLNINSGIVYTEENSLDFEITEDELQKKCSSMFLIIKASLMYFLSFLYSENLITNKNEIKLNVAMEAVLQKDIYND